MKSILDSENDINIKETFPSKCSNLMVEALSIKNEIKKHKWIEGTKGNEMTWSEAKKDWLKHLSYQDRSRAQMMFYLEPYMLHDE